MPAHTSSQSCKSLAPCTVTSSSPAGQGSGQAPRPTSCHWTLGVRQRRCQLPHRRRRARSRPASLSPVVAAMVAWGEGLRGCGWEVHLAAWSLPAVLEGLQTALESPSAGRGRGCGHKRKHPKEGPGLAAAAVWRRHGLAAQPMLDASATGALTIRLSSEPSCATGLSPGRLRTSAFGARQGPGSAGAPAHGSKPRSNRTLVAAGEWAGPSHQ